MIEDYLNICLHFKNLAVSERAKAQQQHTCINQIWYMVVDMARICYLKSLPHWLQQCASSTAILARRFCCESTRALL